MTLTSRQRKKYGILIEALIKNLPYHKTLSYHKSTPLLYNFSIKSSLRQRNAVSLLTFLYFDADDFVQS